jgi:hypothetical protein
MSDEFCEECGEKEINCRCEKCDTCSKYIAPWNTYERNGLYICEDCFREWQIKYEKKDASDE